MARNDNMPAPSNKPADLSYPDIARDYGIEQAQWQSLQNLYPGAQPESIVMVFEYCKVRGLDALKKPVHIVPMYVEDKATGKKGMRDVIMPGIQEMRITAARTREYAGMDEVVFGPDIEVPLILGESSESPQKLTVPQFAKVTVYRLVQGKRYPFTHVERIAEAIARSSDGKVNAMWKKRPSGQLAKCAEAGALRKAFPEELGGEYAAEEMVGREHEDAQIIGGTATEVAAIAGPEEIAMPDAVATKLPDAPTLAPEPDLPKTALQQQREAKPADDDDRTGFVDPAVADAAKARIAEREAREANKAQGGEPEAKPVSTSSLVIDLPAGAASVLKSQMDARGITADQLLGKMGESIAVTNINKALGLIKMWEA